MARILDLTDESGAYGTRLLAELGHDVIRIDTLVSNALGVKPDVDRIARSEQSDARRD